MYGLRVASNGPSFNLVFMRTPATPLALGCPLHPGESAASHSSPASASPPLVAGLVALCLLAASPAVAQWDDFNDGDDAGWTIYDPIRQNLLRPVSTNYVENGAYRILARAPFEDAVGAGRGGAYREDVTYTNFYVAADLVAWDDSIRQFISLGARLGDFGPASTRGYVFGYDRTAGANGGEFYVGRLAYENAEPLGNGPVRFHLEAGQAYRLAFVGKGTSLRGLVFRLPDTFNPVLQLAVEDDVYASGLSGLLVSGDYEAPVPAVAGGDATFDNYHATDREPPKLSIAFDNGYGVAVVTWPEEYFDYMLESSLEQEPNAVWKPEWSLLSSNNFYHVSEVTNGQKYFRLRQ